MLKDWSGDSRVDYKHPWRLQLQPLRIRHHSLVQAGHFDPAKDPVFWILAVDPWQTELDK